MHRHRMAAAGSCPAAILCLKERALCEELVGEVSHYLVANELQFIAELDEFRDEVQAHYFVDDPRKHSTKDAILDAGTELEKLAAQHCSRWVVLDPGSIRQCLSSRPCVTYATVGNWADFLIMIKRMQRVAQGPLAARVVDALIGCVDSVVKKMEQPAQQPR